MFNKIKSKILIAKAKAESLGITVNIHDSETINYKDSGLIALTTIEAYFTFTYPEMLGEYTRKINKYAPISDQLLAKTFLENTFV
jgi:hypothetical protein